MVVNKTVGYDPTANIGQNVEVFGYYDGTVWVPMPNIIRRYTLQESYGEYLPAGRTPFGTGLLRDLTALYRTIDIGVDSNSAYHILYTHSTLSASAGIVIIDRGFLVRNMNFFLKILFISRTVTLPDERLFCGFGPNNLIPETDVTATLFPDGVPCFIIGYRTTDSTYQLFRNDAAGPVVVVDTGVPVPPSAVNYFAEFSGNTTSMTITIRSFSGTVLFTNTYTTEIPAATTLLYWHTVVQQVNPAVTKNMSFRGMFVKARGY